MNFKNGMLGACIIVLGVVATIVLSYALSLDVTDEEVTKYSYMADLNGLFDSEQAPAYIEYNPSTNFTGYYMDPESIIGNTKYFDGVEYKSTSTNQYRLNIAPTNWTVGTQTLSGGDWITNPIMMLYAISDNERGYINPLTGANGDAVPLSEIISNMNLGDSINYISFKSVTGLSELQEPVEDDDFDLSWAVFSSKTNWHNRFLYVGTPQFLTEFGSTGSSGLTINPIMLSCTVDLTTNLVTLYYDNDLQRSGNTYNLDDVVVFFDGGDGGIGLGDTVTYEAYTKPAATYMDIREGVWMED